jgi:surface protein
MSLYLGSNKFKEVYLGSNKIKEVYLGSNKVYEAVDPYNPLNLPPNTVRVVTPNNQPPSRGPGAVATYETATLVPGTTNVYDVYKSGTDFTKLLSYSNIVEILGANTTSITNMEMMFYGCLSLTSIPLFNTSKVTNMDYMFERCLMVQSGALAFYQHASTQAIPPTNHTDTFSDCGRDTTTGAAELAQIPSDWK